HISYSRRECSLYRSLDPCFTLTSTLAANAEMTSGCTSCMNPSLVITGTDTGIGKTSVTSYLAAWLRKKGVPAVPYKPMQSGGMMKDGQLQSEDVAFYKASSALPYSDETLCTYCFEDPVSPHLAMKRSNETIHIPTIMSQLKKL